MREETLIIKEDIMNKFTEFIAIVAAIIVISVVIVVISKQF